MSYPRRYLATLISLSVLGTSLPTVTLAQDQDDDSFLEELVVTARRREENIQDVPISISAFSEQTLRDFNAVGLEDIAELTPGVQFREIGGTPEITMRGLAQTDLLGLQANVGVFIDGVFLNNRSSIDFNNMDLQQIEVLKGPQSALFGRNTFAGAVNYISNPARIGEFDATLDLEAGSDERLTF
ncbi:MAG: Plug domain-containing protein, partial [Pseudomonadota bacterium]